MAEVSNIASLIAQVPRVPAVDFSALGNLPNSYWEGLNQAHTQELQDLFKGGRLPTNPDGSINWDQAGRMLLQAGGAPALPQALSLTNQAAYQTSLNQPAPPIPGVNTPSLSGESSLRPSAGVASTEITPIPEGISQRQFALANPGGIPQAVQAPTPTPSPQISQNAPTPANVVRGGFEAAQGIPRLPSEELAAAYERRAQFFNRRADLAERAGIKGDADRAEASQAQANALQIRKSLYEAGQPTGPMKEAAQAGARNTPELAAMKQEQTDQLSVLKDLAKNGIDAKGRVAQLDAVKQLGEKVGYGAVPKVQSFLGRFGIDTTGLSDIQAYERAVDFMAPQLRPVGSGRLMQQELAAFKSSLGGLMTTPEGRRISVENLKLINRFNSRVGEIASDSSLSPSQRLKQIYELPEPGLRTLWTGPTGKSYYVEKGKLVGPAQ